MTYNQSSSILTFPVLESALTTTHRQSKAVKVHDFLPMVSDFMEIRQHQPSRWTLSFRQRNYEFLQLPTRQVFAPEMKSRTLMDLSCTVHLRRHIPTVSKRETRCAFFNFFSSTLHHLLGCYSTYALRFLHRLLTLAVLVTRLAILLWTSQIIR